MHFSVIGSLFGNECLTERMGPSLANGVEEPKNGSKVGSCSDITFHWSTRRAAFLFGTRVKVTSAGFGLIARSGTAPTHGCGRVVTGRNTAGELDSTHGMITSAVVA